jgi:hypothetical protein
MRNKATLAITILMISAFAFFGFSRQDDCEPLNRTDLRDRLVQLGYEVKDIEKAVGKEKYSVKMNKDGLDIPVGVEISPSGTYIWLTVNLGNPPSNTDTTNNTLLKQNGKIQPCQFYITSTTGRLMMGLPVENKGVTNSHLRDRLESISKNVGSTKDIWQR